MVEFYKLIVTRPGKYGGKSNTAVHFDMKQDCLITAEETFERMKREPDVLELLLFRFDGNGVHELRRYRK